MTFIKLGLTPNCDIRDCDKKLRPNFTRFGQNTENQHGNVLKIGQKWKH